MTLRRTSGMWPALVALTALTIGCEGPVSPGAGNPLDPTDPDYVAPDTSITGGPSEGATVESADVSLAWKGNALMNAYSYRLDDAPWSEWAADASATFTLLDEGEHTLAVKGRYPTLDEDLTPAERTFTVDAVKGPALMFRPRKIVAQVGESFTVQVIAEEVEDLMLAHVEIEYDDSVLRLESIAKGSFLSGNGGTVVFLDDSRAGVADFSTGVGTGEPAGVSGSGALAELTFTVVGAAESSLTFGSGSTLRGNTNRDIPLSERVNGVILPR